MIINPRMAVWYAQPRTTVICAARGALLSGEAGCVADRPLPQMVCRFVVLTGKKYSKKSEITPGWGSIEQRTHGMWTPARISGIAYNVTVRREMIT